MDSASHENEERSGNRKLHRPVRVDIYLKTDSRIWGVVQVLMTNVGEDERDDSICLEWKTDLVP